MGGNCPLVVMRFRASSFFVFFLVIDPLLLCKFAVSNCTGTFVALTNRHQNRSQWFLFALWLPTTHCDVKRVLCGSSPMSFMF